MSLNLIRILDAETKKGIPTVTIETKGLALGSAQTDPSGAGILIAIPFVAYHIKLIKEGYVPLESDITPWGPIHAAEFSLEKLLPALPERPPLLISPPEVYYPPIMEEVPIPAMPPTEVPTPAPEVPAPPLAVAPPPEEVVPPPPPEEVPPPPPPPPPPTPIPISFQLYISSLPMKNIAIKYDAMYGTTPFNISLKPGVYTLTAPEKIQYLGQTHYFISWSDGIENPKRPLVLDKDVSLIAQYGVEMPV